MIKNKKIIVVSVVPLSGNCVASGVGVTVRVGVGVRVPVGAVVATGAPTAVFVGVALGATVAALATWVGVGDVEPVLLQSKDELQALTPGPGTSTHNPNRHSKWVSPLALPADAPLVGVMACEAVGVGVGVAVSLSPRKKKNHTAPPRAKRSRPVITSKIGNRVSRFGGNGGVAVLLAFIKSLFGT